MVLQSDDDPPLNYFARSYYADGVNRSLLERLGGLDSGVEAGRPSASLVELANRRPNGATDEVEALLGMTLEEWH